MPVKTHASTAGFLLPSCETSPGDWLKAARACREESTSRHSRQERVDDHMRAIASGEKKKRDRWGVGWGRKQEGEEGIRGREGFERGWGGKKLYQLTQEVANSRKGWNIAGWLAGWSVQEACDDGVGREERLWVVVTLRRDLGRQSPRQPSSPAVVVTVSRTFHHLQ